MYDKPVFPLSNAMSLSSFPHCLFSACHRFTQCVWLHVWLLGQREAEDGMRRGGSSDEGPATCLAMPHWLVSTHNSRFSAGIRGQGKKGAFHLLCIFTARGLTACLPLGCFISANLATVSTLEVLANPSATQTVCITLQSPIQPKSLRCDTQEACWQYIVQAYIMRQLKKSNPDFDCSC